MLLPRSPVMTLQKKQLMTSRSLVVILQRPVMILHRRQLMLLQNRLRVMAPSLQLRLCSTEPDKGGKIERPEAMGSRGKAKPTGAPISWKNLAATGVFFGGIMLAYQYAKQQKEEAIAKERKKLIGKAKIGGGFDLVDHNGQQRKSEDFLGQWCFLYFGFTHCPDICPEELEKVAEVVDTFEAENSPIQPLFITVDPKRDGVKEVAEYVKEFHPKLIGLTGTEEQIKNACKSFRVYYSNGPADDDDDYIVDHTIIVYLINPDGDFVDYYGQTKDAKMIHDSVQFHMGKYAIENKKGILGGLLSG